MYNDELLEIVNTFNYLGIVISTGGTFIHTYDTLADQTMKAYYKLKGYLREFVNVNIIWLLLVLPVLNYGAETWEYNIATKFNVYTYFSVNKYLVLKQTQNCFTYGELRRMPLRQIRFIKVKKNIGLRFYKVKKKIQKTCLLSCATIERYPDKSSWTTHVRNILDINVFSDL